MPLFVSLLITWFWYSRCLLWVCPLPCSRPFCWSTITQSSVIVGGQWRETAIFHVSSTWKYLNSCFGLWHHAAQQIESYGWTGCYTSKTLKYLMNQSLLKLTIWRTFLCLQKESPSCLFLMRQWTCVNKRRLSLKQGDGPINWLIIQNNTCKHTLTPVMAPLHAGRGMRKAAGLKRNKAAERVRAGVCVWRDEEYPADMELYNSVCCLS